MKNYVKLINQHPQLEKCFFAFSKEQYAKGKKDANIKDEEIHSVGGGLFGTKEGLDLVFNFYEAIEKEIKETCNPQEVYLYEYNNHECGYTGEDNEAIEKIIRYFGIEIAKTINRKNGYLDIDKIII